MKKIITYSAQFKFIQPHQNRAEAFTASDSNPSPNPPEANKKKFTKVRQEFINNIDASGFKQFNQ